ncbi:hypothetical protein KDA23_02250 [Candidatus Saccharibacteria bacterium]|nr:hypothetical protein [Candidatus Saccharibacteria bacterium]MCB9821143.1 hypothetical protein [Candidatus Nomurabacteria bacterium]
MRRALVIVATAMVATLGMLAPPGSPANAAGYCDVPIYAGNDSVSTTDEGLTRAVSDLEAQDVAVHAVVINSVSGQSHEQWLKSALAECPSWYDASTDTGLAPRQLIIVIAMDDRIVDTYVGTGLTVRITQQKEADVRNNVIRDNLAAGNGVTFALKEGMKAYTELLTAPLTQPNTNTGGGVASNQTTSTQNKPVDVPWGVFLWVLAGIVFFVLLFFGITGLSGYLEERRRRRQKYEMAKSSAEAVVARATAVSGQIILEGNYETMLNRVTASVALGNESETRSFLNTKQMLGQRLAAISQQHLTLTRTPNPTTTLGWEKLESDAKKFEADVDSFNAVYDEFVKAVAKYSELITTSSERGAKARQCHAAIALALANLREQGWKTGHFDADVAKLEKLLLSSEGCLVDARFKAGQELLDQFAAEAEALEAEVEALPTLGSTLLATTATLDERLKGLRAVQAQAEALYGQMLDEFGLASLVSIENFGSEADALLDECEVDIPAIRVLASRAVQDYIGAQKSIDEVDTMLTQAEALYHEVSGLNGQLKRMRSKTGTLVEDARRRCERAIRFCNDHRKDVGTDELEALRQIGAQIADIRLHLGTQKHPEYLSIVDQLEKLIDSISQEQDEASEEYESAEAERARLADAEREAREAEKDLGKYIQDHKGDIKSKRLRDLEQLSSDHHIGSELSVAERIVLWQLYEQALEGLHKKCKGDVSAAVEARRPSYSSRSSFGTGGFSTGGSRTSFGSSGFSTGGGRSSFSSFGGGSHHTGGGRSGW